MDYLVTNAPESASSTALLDAAAHFGRPLTAISPTTAASTLENPNSALFRLGLTHLHEGLELARQLEASSCEVWNSSQSMALAKNKWLSHQAFAQHGLDHVPTYKLDPDMNPGADRPAPFDTFPLIVKTVYGAMGAGVFLAQDHKQLEKIASDYFQKSYSVLLQPFMAHDRDLRVFVVNDQLLAAVRRLPKEGEFRSNWHLGGQLEVAKLTDKEKRLVRGAVSATGLKVAGVDLIGAEGSAKLLEVNDSPGLEGISQCCGMNLAEKIISAFFENT